MAVKIRKTRWSDVVELAQNIRPIDKKEIELISGHTPLEALKQGFECSYYCRTILYKGRVIGIFGAAKVCILSLNAQIWLLGATDFFTIRRDLLLKSKFYIKKMMKNVIELENYVWIGNKASLRWLKWCGFEFDTPMPYGKSKALFVHFSMKKEKEHV